MLDWISSTKCWQSHSYRIHLFQGKTADSAGKDGGKKKSKGAEDPGSRTEVGDPERSSLPLFFLKFTFDWCSITSHCSNKQLLQARAATRSCLVTVFTVLIMCNNLSVIRDHLGMHQSSISLCSYMSVIVMLISLECPGQISPKGDIKDELDLTCLYFASIIIFDSLAYLMQGLAACVMLTGTKQILHVNPS